MKRKSHKIQWKLLAGLLVLVAAIVISLSSISAVPYLEGNKSISPNILYVGDSATITLTVSGAGNATNTTRSLDVILIIDNSCSMQGTKIYNAKSAANAFIDELNPSLDRLGLVSFNTYPTVRNSLTNNYGSVRTNINSLGVCGNTNIGEAIKKASEQFSSNSNARAIVLISDGKTNLPADAKAYALQQATNAAAKNITIFTVGVGEGFNELDSNILRSIATAGNGLYWHYPFGNAIDNVFYGITQQSNNAAATNIIVTDFLALGVVPTSLPSGCNYDLNTRKVTCNAGSLNINESRSFSFNVIVYNSSLNHLNEIAYVNYTNYLGNNASFILNNPNVTVLTNSTTCTNCNNTNTTNNSCVGNIAPVLTIASPISKVYNNSLITLNISAFDSNLSHVWYNLNGVTSVYSGPVLANLSNGNYVLIAYANDSCGSLSSVHTFFTVNTSSNGTNNSSDNVGPNVTIISPINQIYNTSLVSLTILAVDDIVVDDVWYTLNGVRYNYVYSSLMNLSNGNYVLIAYANDSSGNIGVDSVSFSVNSFGGENPNNSTNNTHVHNSSCGHNTRAPVNDFDYNETADSVSMDDNFVISLNYQNGSINEGFNMDSYLSGKTNQLIFNMILLIAIIVLLLLIVLIIRRNN